MQKEDDSRWRTRGAGRLSGTHAWCRSICAACLLLGAAGVAAAARAATTPQILEPVTVTATRVATPSYDVPASVDTVGSTQIKQARLGVNLSESVKGIPGLLARNRQNYAQDEQISIRGFGARTAFGVRGVRLYIDGIPASFPDGQGQVSNFNLESASRIEVLRGPFSALYGNSSGGVIQIFTADGGPPDRFGGGVAYGSYDTARANVDANGRVGKLDYNAGFTHFRTGGFRPHSAARRELFNSKLTYHFDAATRLTLAVNTFSGPDAQDPKGLTRDEFERDARQTDASALVYDTRKSAEQNRTGLILDHDFGSGQSLRLMAYYGSRQVKQYLSIPPMAQDSATTGGGVVDLRDRFGGGDARWTWQTELAAQPLTVVAGLTYDDELEHRRGYLNFIGSNTRFSPTCPAGDVCGVQGDLRRDQQDNEYDFAQYLQANWQPGRRWVLTAGVRRNKVNFSSHDHYIVPGNGDDSGGNAYYATTPVAGVLYKAAPWAHLYASFGEGFETPTFSELAYTTPTGGGVNFGLNPARTENGEVGAKLRLPQQTRINLAVFHALTRNEIVVNTSSGGRSTYTNAGRVRRQGVEISGDYAFSSKLHAQLAYTYLDATVRTTYVTSTSTVLARSRLPGVPESQVYAALRWGGATGLNFGVDGQFLSDVPVDDGNTDAAPEYGLLNTHIGYIHDFQRYQLSLFARVNNLLDTDYVGSVIVNDGNGRYFETGPGRSFLVGININWKA